MAQVSTRASALIAAWLFAAVAVFHVAVALGAPWGEYTQGGQTVGTLPPTMRLVAASSALIVAAMSATVLAAAQIGPLRTARASARLWAMRATTAYAALAVVLNVATPSPRERAVWAPVSIVLLVCCVQVLRGLAHHDRRGTVDTTAL